VRLAFIDKEDFMSHPGLPGELPADFFSALTLLASKDRLAVEDMKLMILLETAGEPLYFKLAEKVSNPEAADLLRRNGREETAHAHRLKKAIEILTGGAFEIPPMVENPYAEIPDLGEISLELLAGVRVAEADGDGMYQRYADSEPNSEVADLLRQNGREESRHGERVGRVIEILDLK
jgi:Mn-containing catalase